MDQKRRTFADKCFRDKNGKLALYARPNWPIITWAIAAILSMLAGHGAIHKLLSAVSFAALVIWALMEIFQGVNYFRRALGLLVLAISIYLRFIN